VRRAEDDACGTLASIIRCLRQEGDVSAELVAAAQSPCHADPEALRTARKALITTLLVGVVDTDVENAGQGLGPLHDDADTATDTMSVSAVVSRLRDPDPELRTAAVEAIRKLLWEETPSNASVLSAVAMRSEDPDHRIRLQVMEALGYLGRSGSKVDEFVISVLMEGLIDNHWCVRRSAARALAIVRISSLACAAMPLLHDWHAYVGSAAHEALDHLQQGPWTDLC